jgi:hypothetical protein
MTIATTTSRTETAGDGIVTEFTFPYLFFADDDLTVIVVTDATGAEATQTLNTDYTVAGAGVAAGGTVTMTTAPASGETLVILRQEQFTQGLDLVENDPFPSDQVEEALDKLTMLCQQLNTEVSRSAKLADGDTSGASVTLPTPTANQFLLWSSDGLSIVNAAGTTEVPVSPFMATVLDDLTAAAARTTLGLGSAATSNTGDFEAADTDIVKANETKRRTVGHPVDWYDIGGGSATTPTETSGSKTLDPDNGELQLIVINDSTTINPPATDDDCDIWLTIVQDSTGSRSVTFSGWNATKLPNSKDAVDGTADAESDVLIRVRGSVKKYGIYHNA